MYKLSFASALSALLAFLVPQLGYSKPPHQRVDFSRLVVVGDSLSAGFQNFSLLDLQQPHGYASLVAQQAGTTLTLPLVPYPGIPNVLSLTSLGPPPVIGPVSGSLPGTGPRDNPTEQPTDLAVPGVTIAQVLTQVPTPNPQSPIDQLGNVILGIPNPLAGSQITQAAALKPTTVIAWAGNNDALLPALTGDFSGLTSVDSFHASYKAMLDALFTTGATLITANIPDVTEAGYFEPVSKLTTDAGALALLGVTAQDYLRLSAVSQAQKILMGQAAGPLTTCPTPVPGLGASQIPCVLTAQDATTLRTAIDGYNAAIKTEAAAHGAVLVDIHGLVDRLHTQGIQIGGQQLTTDFLGGLFSLDGFHPTNTGYAVIANDFIDTMNSQLGTQIPDVSLTNVMWLDPFTYLRIANSSTTLAR